MSSMAAGFSVSCVIDFRLEQVILPKGVSVSKREFSDVSCCESRKILVKGVGMS